MGQIKIPITLSPHIVDGKPRGYYLLAQRLFLSGDPILRRDQFVGVNKCLVVTFSRDKSWNTLGDLIFRTGPSSEDYITWFGKCKLYPMPKGFRVYLPSSVLKPCSDAKKIETTGIVCKRKFGGGTAPMYYLSIPKVSAEVLMGKEKL